MTERGPRQARRMVVIVLTKRLLSVIVFVSAMALGLSLGFLAVRLLVS